MAGKIVHAELCTSLTDVIAEQVELSTPPFDGISQVRFSPTDPRHLLVASWDTVSLLFYADRHERLVLVRKLSNSFSIVRPFVGHSTASLLDKTAFCSNRSGASVSQIRQS